MIVRMCLMLSVVACELSLVSSKGDYLTLAFFGAAILTALPDARAPRPRMLLVLVFVVLSCVAIVRAELNPAVSSLAPDFWTPATLVLMGIFGYVAFSGASGLELERRMRAAALAPGVFAATNVILYLSSLAPARPLAYAQPAQLLAFVGIERERTLLPLTTGLNSFGDVAAVGLFASLLIARRSSGRERALAIATALGSLAGALLADTRAGLVAGLVALVTVHVIPNAARKQRWVAVAASSALVVFLALSALVVPVVLRGAGNLGATLYFSRSGDDFTTATDRTYIWDPVVDYVSHPHLVDVVGHGAFGHVTSGVAARYSYLFTSASDDASSSHTVHNAALQAVLDQGYLGLAAFLALAVVGLFVLFRRIASSHSTGDRAALVGLLILLLSGATDVVPSVYFTETLFAFVLLATAALSAEPVAVPVRVPLRVPSVPDVYRRAGVDPAMV